MKKKMGNGMKNFIGKAFLKKDNTGATLVVVIVAMALLGILSSIVLYTTYINYTIKLTEEKANNNFYTGEMAMEEIKAGLEQEVSQAFSSAYLAIMQDYNSYDEVGRTSQFQYLYLSKLQSALQDPTDVTKFNREKLLSYISDSHAVQLADAEVESLVKYTDSIQLKNLSLTYTDAQGYVAVISTDVVLKIPNVHFDSVNTLPDMFTYSMIADQALEAGDVGRSDIVGSIYAGKGGIRISNGVDLYFSAADNLVSAGMVEVMGSGSSIQVAADSTLWADGILADSSTVELLGNTYIQDDLTVQGTGSSITLAGAYYGYGYQSVATGTAGPEDSSSILINGSGTSLDMSGLTRLVLAGQAYVGTKDRDKNGDGTITEDEMNYAPSDPGGVSSAENQDVRMGQSLAVKSDQLAYLVPAECIGVIDGESVIGTNPVSITDYNAFMQRVQEETDKKNNGQPYSVTTEVDLYRIADNLPRKLSEYGASYQRVFYQAAGAGNAWVYYYLKFDSAQLANLFFQDYYTYNGAYLDSYMKNYLAAFRAPESFGRLNLAGNVVFCDAEGNYELTPSTATTDAVTEYGLLMEYEDYHNTFHALTVNLSRNYAVLTDEEKAKSVFANLIDVAKLQECVAGAEAPGIVRSFPASGSMPEVILVDNDADRNGSSEGGVYTIPDDASIRLVIATGDVRVSTNYTGLIIAGGKITISNGANITADPDSVSILLAKYPEVLSCFVGGDELTPEDPDTPTEDVITTESLVSYRNWNKR